MKGTGKGRLLFVSHLFHPAVGGVELHLKNLTAGLARRGYDVGVLTSNALSTEAFFLKDKRRIPAPIEVIDGVRVERLGFHTFGRPLLNLSRRIACRISFPGSDWIRAVSYGPRNRAFIGKIVAADADVIFGAPLPILTVRYACLAAKRTGKPFVCIPSYHIFDRESFYNRLFFKTMREADVLMAQSENERDYLAAEAGVNPNRIVIFPPFPLKENQINPPLKDKSEIRKRHGIKEKYVLLYMGQHGIHKNVDSVIAVMPYVWKKHPDTALVIAGAKTAYTASLKTRAERTMRSGGTVYFIDDFPVDEKDDILQMADVFVCLSELESFGIVFVEALNAGLPVVASRNGVARSVVDEWRTGLLAEPRKHIEVSEAICELLSDDDLRARYAAEARAKAAREYHPERLLDRWETVLSGLCPGRSTG